MRSIWGWKYGVCLFALPALVLFSTFAAATSITGGTTSVTFNPGFVSTLTEAGIKPAAIAPGMLVGTTATFPITGGDTTTGIINHSGGLSFTMGSESADLENFTINLNTDLLTGTVIANGGPPTMGVNLLDLGSGNTLTINQALATDLTEVFGVPNLTGVTVGTATVSPITATPEPATLVLFGIGCFVLGMLAWLRRRSLLTASALRKN